MRKILLFLFLFCSSCVYQYRSICYYSFNENEKSITIPNDIDTLSLRSTLKNMNWKTSPERYYVENGKQFETKYTLDTFNLNQIGIWLTTLGDFSSFHLIIKDNKSNLNTYESWGVATKFQILTNLKKDINENSSKKEERIDKKRTLYSYISP